jgi:hypothetical protein
MNFMQQILKFYSASQLLLLFMTLLRVHENEVVGSSIILVFPLVIADSERDIPGIDRGPLGWYTSALTTGLQEVRQ